MGSIPCIGQRAQRHAAVGSGGSHCCCGAIFCRCRAVISGAAIGCVVEAITVFCVSALGGNGVWLGVDALSRCHLTNRCRRTKAICHASCIRKATPAFFDRWSQTLEGMVKVLRRSQLLTQIGHSRVAACRHAMTHSRATKDSYIAELRA